MNLIDNILNKTTKTVFVPKHLPALPTVYIIKKYDEYIYVGQTENLRARCGYHRIQKKQNSELAAFLKINICDVAYLENDSREERLNIEKTLIYGLRPRFNRVKLSGIPKEIPSECKVILNKYMKVKNLIDWKTAMIMLFHEIKLEEAK